MKEFKHQVEARFRAVQDKITDFLNKINQLHYHEDLWKFEKGSGGGCTRIFQGGDILEKGGVNFSAISGDSFPASGLPGAKDLAGQPFFATGVSLVLHAHHPHIPTFHLNIRYFESGTAWWFGGGVDCTPYYPLESEVISFHQTLFDLCEKHHQPYSTYKKQCDDYFYLPHRQETRGVGGLFFDHLRSDPQNLLAFCEDLGLHIIPLYSKMLHHQSKEILPAERDFQLIRRGRYVEFNLLYDRGTHFGLQTGGRTESILMSLPALVRWEYQKEYPAGSPEKILTDYFLKPQDWLSKADTNG